MYIFFFLSITLAANGCCYCCCSDRCYVLLKCVCFGFYLFAHVCVCLWCKVVCIHKREHAQRAHIYCIFIALFAHSQLAFHIQLNGELRSCLTWYLVLCCVLLYDLLLSRSLLFTYLSLARAHTQHKCFFLHTLLRLNHTDFKQLTFNSGNERTRISVSVLIFVCIVFCSLVHVLRFCMTIFW